MPASVGLTVGSVPRPAVLAMLVGVAVVRLEAMVVDAQPGQIIERGAVGVGPLGGVIDLGDRAPARRADAPAAVAHEDRGALRRAGMAAGVDDGADVDAVADHDPQQRFAEQIAGRRDRDRADTRDLTRLARLDLAPSE